MDNPVPAPNPNTRRASGEWRRLERALGDLHASARSRPAGDPPPCVLIVDDDAATRLLYSVNLELEGIRVLEAADGRRGLELARTERPDLILTDVSMPELDGFELAAALSRDVRTSAIPVVFLSGESTADNDVRAHALGAIAYLTKPLDLDVLGTLVRRVRAGAAPPRPEPSEGDGPEAA